MNNIYLKIRIKDNLNTFINVERYIHNIQRPIERWCLDNIGPSIEPYWRFTDEHRLYTADWNDMIMWKGIYVYHDHDRLALILRFGEHLEFGRHG